MLTEPGVLEVVLVDHGCAPFNLVGRAMDDVGAINVLPTPTLFANGVRFVHPFTQLNPPCIDHVKRSLVNVGRGRQ